MNRKPDSARRRNLADWEIRDDIHEALLTLGCSIICWRRLKNHHA